MLRSAAWAALRQCAFLALPWLLGRAVDAGVREGSPVAAAGYAGAFALAAPAEYAGMRGWQPWSNLAEAHAGTWLRTRLLRAVPAVDTDTLQRRTESFGDLNTLATRDVEAILVWVHGLTTWVVIGITGLVLVPALGGLDPVLLFVAVLTVPALLLPTASSRPGTAAGPRNSPKPTAGAAQPSRNCGGERQLVAIARAALADPAVLVLDEATAGADHDTAGRIEEALSAAAADRTLIVIAHRVDTIARGHRLLAMPSGELTVRIPTPTRP
ncbi:ABC transporter transmembrane domain-containing protein [Streptomyces sp. NPDC059496]|uniref:ABC transporter transmembrane domain-containing protein n=1 Tax=Streptomyces sp. NPDC059496 TaxID=3346851 RepID=UPI00368301CE